MPGEILKLIENVDPDDSNALYEIDGAVHSFLYDTPACRVIYLKRTDGKNTYTRSRDALKSIRPDGCFSISKRKDGFVFIFFETACEKPETITPPLPTEELAELHAIIQAIQWERENGQKEKS